MLLAVRGITWDPMSSKALDRDQPQELPQPISVEPEQPEVPAELPQSFQREQVPRRIYIARNTLEKFGYTAGCPACDHTRLGTRGPGIAHTDQCRGRIEEAMQADPAEAERQAKADERATEWIAKRVDESEAGQVARPSGPGGGLLQPPFQPQELHRRHPPQVQAVGWFCPRP